MAKNNTYVIVGTQFGDEGKGKIIDVLAPKSDCVVRYQGGNNAGHTVVIGKDKFILHLLPSGIISSKGLCLIGAGVVVDPKVLLQEIEAIEKRGISTENRLFIDERAHVIMPYHIALDKAKEEVLGENKIGTTQRGIGPCYNDKISRNGIRIGDLLDKDRLLDKIKWNLAEKNDLLIKYGKEAFKIDEIFDEYCKIAEILKPRIKNTLTIIDKEIKEGKKVLFEGAQALMLDIDFGTYPYVTSSSPSSGGVCTGTGIAPNRLNRIIGVMKAYTTRVGEGPFPTELDNELGEKIREIGNEYGATTGRPRRCGWLDLVMLRQAIMINGLTDIVLTKLDVLTGLPKIKIAKEYIIGDEKIELFPANLRKSQEVEVIYEELDGWDEDISNIKEYDKLPLNCRKYIEYLEKELECPISMVSVGPERSQNIIRVEF